VQARAPRPCSAPTSVLVSHPWRQLSSAHAEPCRQSLSVVYSGGGAKISERRVRIPPFFYYFLASPTISARLGFRGLPPFFPHTQAMSGYLPRMAACPFLPISTKKARPCFLSTVSPPFLPASLTVIIERNLLQQIGSVRFAHLAI